MAWKSQPSVLESLGSALHNVPQPLQKIRKLEVEELGHCFGLWRLATGVLLLG